MVENSNQNKKGFKFYLKKYGYYFVLAGLIAVLAVVIAVSSVLASTNEGEDTPVNVQAIEFVNPVLNASVLKGYSNTELQFNETLNQWEVHKAVDFLASSGANVFACYAGTVTKVYSNVLMGTTIEIDHGDNLKTVYSSLDSDVEVSVGDLVNTGDVIGTASTSATGETTETSQVHFEVWKDGALVDPAGYLALEEK